jgi:hypothetical protein
MTAEIRRVQAKNTLSKDLRAKSGKIHEDKPSEQEKQR